jgi:hypothetical protein
MLKLFQGTMDAVSVVATSAVLLGSIFTTSSWAMEERDREGESHFARLPAETAQNIFRFLPLERHNSLSLVCKTWKTWVNDDKGAFKDLLALKKAYQEQEKQLSEQTSPGLEHYAQMLNNLRKSVTLLEPRSLEDRTGFANQLLNELQNKASISNNLKEEWMYLALFRACDEFLSRPMQDWLEARVDAFFNGPMGMPLLYWVISLL